MTWEGLLGTQMADQADVPRRLFLLVTGARALALYPEAKSWACRLLEERTRALPPGSFVGHGASPDDCPDWWADGIALECGHRVLRWYATGKRTDSQGPDILWRKVLIERPRAHHFLERNRHMAQVLADYQRADRGDVLVLGLMHRKSSTHGTAHTLSVARSLGLETEWRRYPEEI